MQGRQELESLVRRVKQVGLNGCALAAPLGIQPDLLVGRQAGNQPVLASGREPASLQTGVPPSHPCGMGLLGSSARWPAARPGAGCTPFHFGAPLYSPCPPPWRPLLADS